METITILEKFFDRGNVDDILTQAQVKKLFPKNTDSNSVEVVLQYLKQQRHELLKDVKSNINSEFSIPIQDIIKDIEDFNSTSNDRHTVVQLVQNLEAVENSTKLQCEKLDDEIDLMMSEVRQLTDKIKELGEEKVHTEDVAQSIQVLNDMINE